MFKKNRNSKPETKLPVDLLKIEDIFLSTSELCSFLLSFSECQGLETSIIHVFPTFRPGEANDIVLTWYVDLSSLKICQGRKWGSGHVRGQSGLHVKMSNTLRSSIGWVHGAFYSKPWLFDVFTRKMGGDNFKIVPSINSGSVFVFVWKYGIQNAMVCYHCFSPLIDTYIYILQTSDVPHYQSFLGKNQMLYWSHLIEIQHQLKFNVLLRIGFVKWWYPEIIQN